MPGRPGTGDKTCISFSSASNVKARTTLAYTEAQNITEYALARGVIALGAVAGMNAIADGVNQTLAAVTNVLTNAIIRS